MLTLALIGGLEVCVDGRPCRVRRTISQRALAYLALHPDVDIDRRHLAYGLWPDVPPAMAMSQLRSALHWLNADLGGRLSQPPPILEARRRNVRWSGRGRVVTDVGALSRAAQSVLDLPAGAETGASAERAALEAAVADHPGRLLPGWDDDWVLAARRRLEGQVCAALERLVSSHQRAGDSRTAQRLDELLRSLATAHAGAERFVGEAVAPSPTWRDATAAAGATASLIGRDRALREVIAAVQGHRMATLTGAPGVGKSALASAVARAIGGTFGGARWLDLSEVEPGTAAAAAVAEAWAQAADVASDAHGPTIRAATGRLVVVDGADTVYDGVGTAIEAMLADDPTAHVLVTSRRPLGLDGEHVVAVAPLDPAHAAALVVAAAEAPVDVAVVRVMVHASDGLPLGLVRAAQALREQPVEALVAAAASRPDRLGPRAPGGPVRHRNLATAIASSWAALGIEARHLIVALAAANDGLSIAALADAVGPVTDRSALLGAIRDVVDHGLVAVVAAADGRPTRYRVLRPIAAYALANAPS